MCSLLLAAFCLSFYLTNNLVDAVSVLATRGTTACLPQNLTEGSFNLISCLMENLPLSILVNLVVHNFLQLGKPSKKYSYRRFPRPATLLNQFSSVEFKLFLKFLYTKKSFFCIYKIRYT